MDLRDVRLSPFDKTNVDDKLVPILENLADVIESRKGIRDFDLHITVGERLYRVSLCWKGSDQKWAERMSRYIDRKMAAKLHFDEVGYALEDMVREIEGQVSDMTPVFPKDEPQ